MRTFIVVGVVIGLLFSAGCGYTTRSNAYPSGTTIYVSPFKNNVDMTSERSEYRRYRTYFPLLEATITRTVIDRFLFDGSLRVGKPDRSDLVLKGELTAYQRDALRYADNNEDVEEYRITVWVNIRLYNGDTDELMWEKRDQVNSHANNPLKEKMVAVNKSLNQPSFSYKM